ncbi:hypothetical protein OPKNFCMD_6829 [Methylobacterium crusticola]|uniref:Uncharacterized protein n=1 Tax=Methylobacterium crusticola TaxID=1697972 RepID=A0ABQ4RBA2_9HYPH|nr:hypothetical protein OPKNFCMD_6829 [Methylobacterium crusticola]
MQDLAACVGRLAAEHDLHPEGVVLGVGEAHARRHRDWAAALDEDDGGIGARRRRVEVDHRRVVDRHDREAHGGIRHGAVRIDDTVGDDGRAVEVRGRREGERTVGVERHRAVGDGHCLARRDRPALDHGDSERVAVGIGIGARRTARRAEAGDRIEGDRDVLGRRDGVVDRDRGRVGDGEDEARLVWHGAAVGRRDRDRVGAAPRRGSVEGAGDDARRADRQAGRQAGRREGEGVAVGVSEEVRDVERHGLAVRPDAVGNRARDRRVVDRGDHDRHRRGVGAAVAVVDRIGEGLGAVEVRVRREKQDRAPGPPGDELHDAVARRDSGTADDQRDVLDADHHVGVAVRIDVVAQDIDEDRHVLDRVDHGVVLGLRRQVVHRVGELARRPGALGILGRDGDQVVARARRPRGVGGDRARDDAARRDGEPRRQAGREEGEPLALGIAEIARDVDGDRVAVVAHGVGDRRRRDRRVVHRGDRDVDDRGREAALAVADPVHHRVDAAVIDVRRVPQGAVRVDRDRAVGRHRGEGGIDEQGVAVGVDVVADDVDVDARVLRDRHGVVDAGRRRVGDGEDEARRGGRGAVRCGDGDGVDAVAGRPALAGVAGDRAGDRAGRGINREARRQAGGGEGEGVALGIGEERREDEGLRAEAVAIGADDGRDRRGGGRVVHARDHHRQGRGVGAAVGVLQRVDDAGGARLPGPEVGKVWPGREGEGAVGRDREAAARRATHRGGCTGRDRHPVDTGDRQRVSVVVLVVVEHVARSRSRERRHGVGEALGRDVGDEPGEGPARAQGAVRGGDRHAVDAAPHGRGVPRDGARDEAGDGIDGEALRQTGRREGEGNALRVREVDREVLRLGEHERLAVGVDPIGDRGRDRGVVGRQHRDPDAGAGKAAVAVADRVDDRVGPVEVRGRRVDERAAVDRDGAGARGGRHDGQRVGVRVDVVGQHRDADRHVLGGGRGVVDGDRRRVGHRQGEGLAQGLAARVGGRHGDRVDPAADLARAARDGAGEEARHGVDHQPLRQAGRREGERVVVGVAEEVGEVVGEALAVGPDAVGDRRDDPGRVVHRRHRHQGRRGVAAAVVVDDRVGEGFLAGEIRVGREAQHLGLGAVEDELHAAVGSGDRRAVEHQHDVVDRDHPLGIAVRVGVVAEDRDDDRGVLGRRRHVVARLRRQVEHRIGEAHAARRAARVPHRHGHRVGQGSGRTRGVRHQPAGDAPGRRVEAEPRRQPRRREAEGLALRVAEERARVDRVDVAVVADAVGDRGCDGRVVDRRHRHAHRCARGAAVAVRDRVDDRVDPVEVRVRRVGDRAVLAEGHRAVSGAGGDHPQRVAVGIGIRHAAAGAAVEHVESDGGVLEGAGGVVARDRGRVGHHHGVAVGRGAALPVRDGDDHRVGTVAAGAALAGVAVDGARDEAVRRDRQARRQAGRREGQTVAVDVGEIGGGVEADRLPVGAHPVRQGRRRHRRVVGRRHGDGDVVLGEPPAPVGDDVAEAVGAVEIGRRLVGEGAVRVDRHGAARRRRAAGRVGDRVAVGIEGGRQGGGQRRILAGGVGGIRCDRRVVDRGDKAGDRGARRAALAVRDGVGERDRAVDVGARHEGQGAVGVERDAAACHRDRAAGHDADAVDGRDRQRVTVAVAVVPQNRDGDGGVLGAGEAVRECRRGVLDRRHQAGDGGAVAAAVAVRERVGERDWAVEIGLRHEGEGAVGVERHRAAGDHDGAARRDEGAVDLDQAEDVAVDVAVVATHLEGDGTVLRHGEAVVAEHRRVIDRGEGAGDGCRRDTAAPVRDGVREGDRAVEVQGRHEGEGPVGVQGHGAARHRDRAAGHDAGAVDGGNGQRVAVGVAVVRQHRDQRGRVLGAGEAVGERHRRILDRRHHSAHRRGGAAPLPVRDGIGERERSVEVELRHEAERAVGVERDRASRHRDRRAGGNRPAVDGGDRQRVRVDVRIVRQHGEGRGRVLGCDEAIGGRHRGVVDRRDGAGDRGRGAAALPVRDGVGERHRAVGVRGGREGQRAVAVQGHGAVRHRDREAGRDGLPVDRRDRQRRPLGIGVVEARIDGDRLILAGRDPVALRDRRVVGAGHDHGRGAGGGAALAVGERIGRLRHPGLARREVDEVGAGLEAEAAIRSDREAAARRARDRYADEAGGAIDGGDGKGVAVRVEIRAGSVIRQHRAADRRVLVGREGIVPGDRHRVRHREGEGAAGGEPEAVGGGDRDRVGAAGARAGRQGAADEARRGIDGQARRQARGGEAQSVAGIRIGEAVREGQREGRAVLSGLVGDRRRDRRVVAAGDRDGEARIRHRPRGVGDPVGDGGRAALTLGEVGEGAGRVEGRAAVGGNDEAAPGRSRHEGADLPGRPVHRDDRERVAVRIGIVDEQARGDWGVRVGGGGVGCGDRRVVDRRDRHRDRVFAGDRAVVNRVGEAVEAVGIGLRHVQEGAVRTDVDPAVRRLAAARPVGHDVAIDVARGRQPALERRVLRRRDGGIRRHRGVVDRRHRDGAGVRVGERAARTGIAAIVRHHRQRDGAVDIRCRREERGGRPRQEGVDRRDGAGEDEAAGAGADDRDLGGRGRRQGAAID